MDKILITGANGFFASRFYYLYKNKYEIIPLSREKLDITNENEVIRIFKNFNPQYILHTAAIANTNICEEHPNYSQEVNLKGTINVGKASSLVGAKLINFSSEQVYNGNEECGPYSETIKAIPNTVYGKHKLQGEIELAKIMEEVWNLRFTWMFSYEEKGKKMNANIISNILNSIGVGNLLKLPSNEFRGMTYVYEAIENILKVLDIDYGIYNMGSENELSTYEVGKLIVHYLNLNENLLIKDEERYKDKARDLRINNKKLKEKSIIFSNTNEGILKCLKNIK